MIPHLAEECWSITGGKGLLSKQPWPSVENKFLINEEVTIVVQINGKRRGEMKVEKDLNKDLVLKKIDSIDSVRDILAKGKIVREVFVPNKIINIVVK